MSQRSSSAAAVAAYPLVTLKSLLENPAVPSRHYRKLLASGNTFSMNSKKDQLSGLSSTNGLANLSSAVATQAGWAVDQFESAASQAFLGPSIWDKSNPYDSMTGPVGTGHDFKLEYMDLDEFLSENGLGGGQSSANGPHGHHSAGSGGVGSPHDSTCSTPTHTHLGSEDNKVSSTTGSKERDSSPGDASGVPHAMVKDVIHVGQEMTGADLALATVPGSTVNFDPRRRRFSEEELKPQPMVKKSKKQFVPDELKDEKYWARRRKNNLAAKRSRDARRVKENQIAIRAAYLEKENAKLREQLDKLTRENMLLREKLSTVAKVDHTKTATS